MCWLLQRSKDWIERQIKEQGSTSGSGSRDKRDEEKVPD